MFFFSLNEFVSNYENIFTLYIKKQSDLPPPFSFTTPPPATEATIYCDEALSQQQFSCEFFVVVAKFTIMRARPYPHGLDSVWPVLGMNRHTQGLHLNAYRHYPPTFCTFNCKYS